MFFVLLFLFVVLPLVELYVIVEVAQGFGWLNTIGLLIVDSLVGAFLMRREGTGILRKVQTQLNAGAMPTKELVDGALIVFAGALMLTPGFVTDIVGFLLLIPPTRIAVRTFLMRRFKGRVQTFGTASFGGSPLGAAGAAGRPSGFSYGRDPFYDVDATERPTDRDIVDLTRDDDTPPTAPPALDS